MTVRAAGVSDPGYRIREEAERCFEHAAGAKSFRRIGKDFCTALSANSNYARHYLGTGRRMGETEKRRCRLFAHPSTRPFILVVRLAPQRRGVAARLRCRRA